MFKKTGNFQLKKVQVRIHTMVSRSLLFVIIIVTMVSIAGIGKSHEALGGYQEAFTPLISTATGPLVVNPGNPRYFMDGSGRTILLTGSHTWSNFQDNGGSDPPPVFDYTAYLDFLQANNHNFF